MKSPVMPRVLVLQLLVRVAEEGKVLLRLLKRFPQMFLSLFSYSIQPSSGKSALWTQGGRLTCARGSETVVPSSLTLTASLYWGPVFLYLVKRGGGTRLPTDSDGKQQTLSVPRTAPLVPRLYPT